LKSIGRRRRRRRKEGQRLDCWEKKAELGKGGELFIYGSGELNSIGK
jgi:hypothetical protein